jgi:protease-4
MTSAERAYMGRLLDDVYEQFLEAVSETRGIPHDRMEDIAEGRLFTGREAVDVGLVDRVGTYEDAVRMAARMGGIEGDPQIVKKHRRRSLYERIFGESAVSLARSRAERISLKYIIP